MKDGKLTEKIVKGLIVAGGTLIGMAISAFIRTKEDPDEIVDGTEVPAESEVIEEVTEG